MRYLICLGLLFSFYSGVAQDEQKADSVICYADGHSHNTQVLFRRDPGLRASASPTVFETNFTDFPDDAKKAFQEALSIWSGLIVSRVPIRIKASWVALAGNTLASSGATRVFKNFNGAVYKEVWYPVALAEAMSGTELNNSDFDINISLNKNILWSYDLTGRREAPKYDLMTVVLHEIGHGLGLTSSLKLTENLQQGQWGQSGTAYIYDMFVQNPAGSKLIDTGVFGNPSTSLRTAMTANNVLYGLTLAKYKNNLPKIYSPATFREGGSISHLDESAYPPGTEHSLMSPNIGAAEVIHDPGSITLAILNLIGWPVSYSDGFVITANEPVSESARILLYPNPVSSQLQIYMPTAYLNESTLFNISDQAGKKVKEFVINTVENPSSATDVSNLASGTYFLRINTGNQTQTVRFIKL